MKEKIKLQVGDCYFIKDRKAVVRIVKKDLHTFKGLFKRTDSIKVYEFWYKEDGRLNIGDESYDLVEKISSDEFPEYFI